MMRVNMKHQRGHMDFSFIGTIFKWAAWIFGLGGAGMLSWGIYLNSHAAPGNHAAGYVLIVIGVAFLLCLVVEGLFLWWLG